MRQVYDVIDAINQTLEERFNQREMTPCVISISPRSYRWLIERMAENNRIGNLLIGCTAICELSTSMGVLPVVIDEALSDAEVRVDCC